MSKELQNIGIIHGLLDSPTGIAARNKIEKALIDISDDKRVDAGMGFGEWDFWVKINSIEYFVTIKPPSGEATKGE